MTNVPIVTLGVVLLIGGVSWPKYMVAELGVLFLMIQALSRYRLIRRIRKLREKDGQLEALVAEPNKWVSVDGLKRVVATNFPYADPWRPISLGYPGLKLYIDGVEEKVEVLFAYGMESARDEAVEELAERYPDAILENEELANSDD
jgi:hypothetical protein